MAVFRLVVLAVAVAAVLGGSVQPVALPAVNGVARGRGLKGAPRREGAAATAPALVAAASSAASGPGGTSDVPTSVFNLAKTILGAGVLSLPSGVAAFSDDLSGLAPASALLVVMGIISAYSFASIGRACRLHKTTSFAEAWAKSVDSPGSAVLISSVITFKTFFACLAYSIIVGDSFSSIGKTLGLPPVLTGRSNVILGLTALVIFPLCLLKNLDALKTTSMLGLGGILYCALFMVVRLVTGSYPQPPAAAAAAAARSPKASSAVFVLISMISTAYVAHYNAPKFYNDLKNKDDYNLVVVAAFGFAALMYMTVMWAGFLSFGRHSTGFILNNYASSDKAATVARLAIGLAILFGYPLTFGALREGVFDLVGVPGGVVVSSGSGGRGVAAAKTKASSRREELAVPATVGLIGLITALSLVLKNLGLVVSFSGALIGAMLIYTVPAIMNIGNIRRGAGAGGKDKGRGGGGGGESQAAALTTRQRAEVAANVAMAAMGCVIAVIGVATTLKGAGH